MNLKAKVLFAVLMLAVLTGVLAVVEEVQAADSQQQIQFTSPVLIVNSSFLNVRTGPGIQYSILVTLVGGSEMPVLGVARDRVWYQVSTIAGVGWVNVQFTLPRGDFTNVPFVEAPQLIIPAPGSVTALAPTTTDDAVAAASFSGGREWGITVRVEHNFRTRATQNSSSLGLIIPDPSRIFTLLESVSNEGIVWHRIDVPDLGIGWVEGPKSQFRPYACELTAIILTSTAFPTVGPDGTGTIDGNVRLEAGEEAYLIDARAGQYKIEILDGNQGWIPESIAQVRTGVRSEYCDSGGVRPVVPGPGGSPTTPTQPTASTPRVVINTGFLNIRSGPGVQYSIVATVPGGTELPVLGIFSDRVWYLVQGSFGQGWVNSEYTLFRGNGTTLPIIRQATGATVSTPVASITNAVTLYAAPNTTLGVVGAISGPVQVPIVARTPDFAWVQLSTSLGFGWVQAQFVTIAGDTTLIPVVGS